MNSSNLTSICCIYKEKIVKNDSHQRTYLPYKFNTMQQHFNLKTFIPFFLFLFDNEDDIFIFSRNVRNSSTSEILLKKKIKNIWNINYIHECVKKYSMTIVCNIWMICFQLNWLFYGLSLMLQLSEFSFSFLWVVFIKFLFIDSTDRSKTSSDQKLLFFDVGLYPLLFFGNTPF